MEKQSGSHHRVPPGREDWWSEDATETLIEAWGDRYVKLNRGNLRQKDWTEVADAVNSRHCNGRSKTDVQCKNRIDTLKKKYKTEKAKPSPSKWRFFDRLDSLIGSALKKSHSPAAGAAVKSSTPNPMLKPGGSNSTDSSLDDDEDYDDDDEGEEWGFVPRKHRRVEEVDLRDVAACKELSRAIFKFGAIYERIESAKQQMMIELEKQRMEMTKEVELQRMNMLMEMQLELEKLKHRKHGAGSGKKRHESVPSLHHTSRQTT